MVKSVTTDAVEDMNSRSDSGVTVIGQDSPHTVSEVDSVNITETAPHSSNDVQWPSVWNVAQIDHFVNANVWLFARNGNLGCTVCRNAATSSLSSAHHLTISTEWSGGTVSHNGTTREQQLTSLRKKIHEHKMSDTHSAAQKLLLEQTGNNLPQMLQRARAVEINNTCKIFNTCYYLLQQERPFTDLPALVDLQRANGLDMGVLLHSRITAGDICEFIGDNMRKKLLADILKSDSKLSVMIDESTSKSNKTTLVVCLKTVVRQIATTFFLDLVVLQTADSASIATALLTCLNRHGFNDDVLSERLVCFASDGASCMLGRTSGVAQTMTKSYPSIITWHCANHRLELAVHDAACDVAGISHFKIFLDKLYSLYSCSPKNRNQLEAAAESLSAHVRKLGRVLDTRWVSSSFSTITAVLTSYCSLAEHFRQASEDTTRDSRDRAKFKGLLRFLQSTAFVLNLSVMADALGELSHLSKDLQARTMTVVSAHRKIHRLSVVFEARKTRPGQAYAEAQKAVASGEFRGVAVLDNGAMPLIDPCQFYQSLSDNMRKRLLTTASSRNMSTQAADADAALYRQLLADLEMLDPSTWSDDATIVDGDVAMSRLSRRFRVNERATIDGFRSYFESTSDEPPVELKPLCQAVDCLVVSTAECERAFSVMNDIESDVRSSLGIKRLSALMFPKMVGPKDCSAFHAEWYVSKWLASGRHSADDTDSRKRHNKDAAEYTHLHSIFR